MNKDPSKKKSKYYGVSWHWTKDKGKWQVTRNYTPMKKPDDTYKFYDNKLPRKGPKKEYKSSIKAYNGCYENEEQAARASDQLYRKLHKQGLRIWCFKRLNFPNESDKIRQNSMKAGETIVDKDGVRYQRVAKHKYMFFDRNCQRWVAEIKRFGIRASSTDEDVCYKDFVYKALRAGIDPTTGKSTMNEAEKARAQEEKIKEELKKIPMLGKKSRNRKRRKVSGQKTKRKRVKREPDDFVTRIIDDSDEPWTPGCEKQFKVPPPMIDRSKNIKRKVLRTKKEKPWKTPPSLAYSVVAVNMLDSPKTEVKRLSQREVKKMPVQTVKRLLTTETKILPSDLNKRALELKRLRSPARLRLPDTKTTTMKSMRSPPVPARFLGRTLITPKPLKRSAVAGNHVIKRPPPRRRSRTPHLTKKITVKKEENLEIPPSRENSLSQTSQKICVKKEENIEIPPSQKNSLSQTSQKTLASSRESSLSQRSQNDVCSPKMPKQQRLSQQLSQASTASVKSFSNVNDGLLSQRSVEGEDDDYDGWESNPWENSGIPFQLPCSGDHTVIPPACVEPCDPLKEDFNNSQPEVEGEIQMLDFFNP